MLLSRLALAALLTVSTTVSAACLASAPKLVNPSGAEPEYPKASRALGESGTVFVRIAMQDRGTIEAISVARSSSFARLDEAALKWAWRVGFSPATDCDGTALAGSFLVPVRFVLEVDDPAPAASGPAVPGPARP